MPIHLESLFVNKGANLFGKFASFNGLIVVIFTPIITNVFSKVRDLKKSVIAGILYTIGFGLLGFIQFKLAFLLSVFIFILRTTWKVIGIIGTISTLGIFILDIFYKNKTIKKGEKVIFKFFT